MYRTAVQHVRRLPTTAIVATLLLAIVAVFPMNLTSRAEAAQTCTTANDNHCYAIAQWDATGYGGFRGATAQIRTNCQIINDYATDLLTSEMWLIKDPYWVEVGTLVGIAGNDSTKVIPSYFWADNRPGVNNFHAHNLGTAALNTYVQASLVPGASAGKWQAHIDGAQTGYSSSNFTGSAGTLETGTETTNNLSRAYGSSRNLSWLSTDNKWYTNGWSSSGGSGHASLYVTNTGGAAQMHANWVTQYSWVQDGEHATC